MNRNSPATAAKLVAFWFGLTGIASAGPDSDPRAWLELMSSAMSQMSYQGTFVYIRGDEVETMRITHVSGENGVQERLVSVSGSPREILRDSNGVRWVLGDDRSVLEDSAFNRSFFPELPADQQEQINNSYTLRFARTERIAGHSARNLKILPRDNYRYGYSLWLEEHSGLLLKWELIDSNRNSLAKLMFTDIRLGSEVDARELKPTSQLQKFKTVESKLPAGRGISHRTPRWKPDRLPPGFELTAHRFFGEAGSDMYEHLVYSDGLAAVSIYIEGNLTKMEKKSELNSLETTHAYTRTAENVIITVMGDVPAVTVEFIANAVGPVYP